MNIRVILCVIAFLSVVYSSEAQPFSNQVDEEKQIKADESFKFGVKGKGTYYVWYGCGSNKIDKPLILVEGYDPTDDNDALYIYDLIDDHELALHLRQEGYDIIGLNFKNGDTYIQRNAFVFTKLIQEINDKLDDNNSDEPIDVIGFSMGGLVARYGLAWMEDQGKTHNVRNYISFDSPHQNANVPLGMQHMFNFWVNNLLITGILATNTPQLIPIAAALNTELFAIGSPAAEQMLFPYYTGTNKRQNWLSDLNDVGNYPTNLRKIAVSNGSICGNDQGYDAGDPYFKWHHNTVILEVKSNVWALPGEATDNDIFKGLYRPGVLLNISDKEGDIYPPIDNSPGGYHCAPLTGIASIIDSLNLQPATVKNECFSFIPLISALDLNTTNYHYDISSNIPDYPYPSSGITPFDAIFASSFASTNINLFHLTMTSDLKKLLKLEVSPTVRYIEDKTYASQVTVKARNGIVAGQDVEPANFMGTGTSIKNRTNEGPVIVGTSAEIIYKASDSIVMTNGFETKGEFETVIENWACIPNRSRSFVQSKTSGSHQQQTNETTSTVSADIDTSIAHLSPGNSTLYETNLDNIYPNPIKNRGTIAFSIGSSSNVTINLHNAYGKVVDHLIEDELYPPGHYEMPFNARSLSHGVFFATFQTKKHQQTKRFVVVK